MSHPSGINLSKLLFSNWPKDFASKGDSGAKIGTFLETSKFLSSYLHLFTAFIQIGGLLRLTFFHLPSSHIQSSNQLGNCIFSPFLYCQSLSQSTWQVPVPWHLGSISNALWCWFHRVFLFATFNNFDFFICQTVELIDGAVDFQTTSESWESFCFFSIVGESWCFYVYFRPLSTVFKKKLYLCGKNRNICKTQLLVAKKKSLC